MVNSVVVVGRVGQNPEMKYFDSGKVKVNFSVAVNRWDSKTKEEITDWFNIEIWDKQAEFAGEWVKKVRSWELKEGLFQASGRHPTAKHLKDTL